MCGSLLVHLSGLNLRNWFLSLFPTRDHCVFLQDLSLPNGTPADTSSPASSSSLLNRLQLDDDLDGEMRDLFVTVDDPKKHVCTMETYITYRVTTKVPQDNLLYSEILLLLKTTLFQVP